MKRALVLTSPLLFVFSTACSTAAENEEPAGSCSAAITAAPENNYSFHSTLSFPPVSVMPDAELTFDWSALATDLVGHSVDPLSDIDSVSIMLWQLTHEELEVKLNADDLAQRNLAVVGSFHTQNAVTSTNVFTFTSPSGMALTRCDILPFLQLPNPDPEGHPECPSYAGNVGAGFDQTANTYTVMVASGTELGAGTRMIQAFELDAASTNTTVTVTSESSVLDYGVNLHDLTPTRVPRGTGDITVDWSTMTVNSSGHEFIPKAITEALIARYDLPVSEIERQFLDLDLLPAERFRATIEAGTSVNLSTFENEAGEAFTGIDTAGTWVLALICGACRNPAPWYLTTLTSCGQ